MPRFERMKVQLSRPGHRASPPDFWISYSDLMASLLLVFVLVLITAMEFHEKQVAARNRTIAEQQEDLRVRGVRLASLQKTLDEKTRVLASTERRLRNRSRALDKQKRELARIRKELAERETELTLRTENLVKTRGQLATTQKTLATREEQLRSRTQRIEKMEAEIARIREKLTAREDQLAARTREVEKKDRALADARKTLAARDEELGRRASQIQQMETRMEEQRTTIETLFGVRRSIVEELRRTFERSHAGDALTVDPATGAIRFGKGILFDEGLDQIRPEAEPVLEEFLQSYLKTLLGSETFRPHVAQIIIEGHTNDNGTYMHNLDLSQRRSLSVMRFLQERALQNLVEMGREMGRELALGETRAWLKRRYDIIRAARDLRLLQDRVTASGRSESELIYNDDGTVDKERSRRIEFKFRLKDEETLRRIEEALGG